MIEGRTGTTALFSPPALGPGDQVIVDILTAKGLTVLGDDGDLPPANSVAIVIHTSSGANPTRFTSYAAPLLTYNASDHDDELTSSIGLTAATLTAETGSITTEGHPAAGGKTGSISLVANEQPYDTIGTTLPDAATVVASVVTLVAPPVESLAMVDAMVAGTEPSNTSEGFITQADLNAGSTGDWDFNNALPGEPSGGFGVVATGNLEVSTSGTYSFAVGIDDGARLRIDLNRNGTFEANENIVVEDASGGFRRIIADVTFSATGTYAMEWVSFNSAGDYGAELSVTFAPGGGAGEPINFDNWTPLGEHFPEDGVQLVDGLTVTTYISTADPVEQTRPFIVVVEEGDRLLGGELTGNEGDGFLAASGLNKFGNGGEKAITFNPINVAGREGLKLTFMIAGTEIDFETSDYLIAEVDPNNTGSFQEVVRFSAPNGDSKYFSDGTTRVGHRFVNVSYDLPTGSNMVLRFRVFTTWWNEIVAIDNVRVSEGSVVIDPPPDGGGDDLVSLPHPGTPGTGLDGRYWKAPTASVLTIAEDGLSVMKSRLPDGTFTATSISYEGNDLTGITEWLGADGASFSGNASNLDDGVLSFTGYIGVTEAGTVNFNVPSDDGVVVWISGQKVVDNDGSHGAPGPAPEGSFDFPDAGLYPIEIAYFNGDWTDEAGNHGGANINFTSDGGAGLGGAGEVVPVAALYSASAVGSAAVPASNAGMIPGEAGTGLSGRYWQLPPATLTNILDRGGDGDIGLKTIQSVTPSGYFNAATINYTGNDLTPILEWLGSDSSSYRGLEGNMDDGLLSLRGFIAIDEAGEHTFSTPSDDGSIVWIGGVKVVDNDGSHGAPGPAPDGTAVFSSAGLYPIEIAYYNADWTDDAGNHGGANINFTMDGGDTVSSAILYPANSSFEMVGMDIGIEGDPVVPGSSEIRNPYPDVYDVDVVAGGSDIWGNDDSGHFVYTEWTGDFDATVEVTRLDVINQWSKAGISVRESLDTGSRHVYVNVDSAAEPPLDNPGGSGANTYEMGVRVATDGGTSNWDENGGTPRMNVPDSTLPAWIRVTRLGDEYTAYRSSNGVEWTMMGSLVQDHPDTVFVSLGTTSHNNGGEEFLTTAHYRNFTIVTPMVDINPPVMGISRSGAQVVITWDKGDLQSAASVNGPWTNVEVVPVRGQPAVPATSPFTADATGPGTFYRVVD